LKTTKTLSVRNGPNLQSNLFQDDDSYFHLQTYPYFETTTGF